MIGDLFEGQSRDQSIADGAMLYGGLALPVAQPLLDSLPALLAAAPFRHLTTPGGAVMSVAMTNCGARGWVSDRSGYRYETQDPLSGQPWPAMPDCFLALAQQAAAKAGFAMFDPDVCLINRYAPGARLTLHQDRDEGNVSAPIVSVSFGLPAVFLFGGLQRKDRPHRFRLQHGDVVVWGGPARMAFHGVMPVEDGDHPVVGRQRLNLTFRQTDDRRRGRSGRLA